MKSRNLYEYYVEDGLGLRSGIRLLAPNWNHARRLYKQNYPKEYKLWGPDNLRCVQPIKESVDKTITKKQEQFYKEILTEDAYEPASIGLLHDLQLEHGVLHAAFIPTYGYFANY